MGKIDSHQIATKLQRKLDIPSPVCQIRSLACGGKIELQFALLFCFVFIFLFLFVFGLISVYCVHVLYNLFPGTSGNRKEPNKTQHKTTERAIT